MIENTFLILPRIKDERRIWEQGIRTWEDFLSAEKVKGLSKERKLYCDRLILRARKALHSGKSDLFFDILPSSEMWRLYEAFKDEAVFLDIETCSTDDITLIGFFDGLEYDVVVKNIDAAKVRKHLQRFKVIVTFNGVVHDLPRLRKYHDNIIPNIPCIDLRTVCARLGIKGGLKDVEKRLSLERPEHLVPNCSVASLWRTFLASGDERYLSTLIEYNEYDTVNLKKLADISIKALTEKTLNTTP